MTKLSRRDFLKIAGLGAATMAAGSSGAVRGASKPNVLFIAVDDLRPMLGCYGDKTVLSPNIDALAKRGMVFERAYCQQAVCSPSRQSLMTGLRPDTIKVWDLAAHFRDALPEAITLPQHFKAGGYHTRSIGKIYHGGGRASRDEPSWSEPAEHAVALSPKVRYANPENLKGRGLKRDSTEAGLVSGDVYIDQIVCSRAVGALGELKKKSKPFFLAVGFRKPHLPFCAPKKYWDMYDRAKIPAPESAEHPAGAPELAVRSWRELEGYRDIPRDGKIPLAKVRKLRHGYYACVSYIDDLVGRLLKELDRLGLRDNTVVVLWGDHGFHLGEQGLWAKANNYEWSARAPLILSVPGQPNTGRRTRALVEFVDIYPTLAGVCGLSVPKGLEGVSMTPLLSKPDRPWKKAAFSQYPRNRTSHRHRKHGQIMGYAIRTDRYRYVEWRIWDTKKIVARELYDHRSDAKEMLNIAPRAEHKTTVEALSKLLHGGWRAALPPGKDGDRARTVQ
ncbi:MAG: sulfatase-like hydrolase/transferase [Phycisphaerae bacterium]|jgi:iduronate 2-sulfatase|nr:sulfatase-like hydrolase/transferase [Phycisphaerae bacterium]